MGHTVSRQKGFGFSLIEVVFASALFGLFATTFVSAFLYGQESSQVASQYSRAVLVAEEGLEVVRSIRDIAWNTLSYDSTGLASTTPWSFLGEGTTDTLGEFNRSIFFEDVCRDSAGAIADCPADYIDVHTQHVTATVDWKYGIRGTSTVSLDTYLTNWNSIYWTQTNWAGGSGQAEWLIDTRYSTDDGAVDIDTTAGQVSLLKGGLVDTGFEIDAGVDSNDWAFTTGANYTYNASDIEVTGGVAQLVSGVSTVSGNTLNKGFDLSAVDWTYVDWEDAGNRVSGTYQSTGGNPGGQVDISVDKQKSAIRSGYWQQAFTTTVDNPSVATTTLDWVVSQYSAPFVSSFQVYVFVDSLAGAPTLGQEVWSSGEITGTTGWASVPDIDVSSQIGLAGTYYLKVAVRVVTTGGGGAANGTNSVGLDNISLHWEGAGSSYPTDVPDIYPNDSFTVSGPGTWSGFTETATKNGGEIYYQLSDDDGSSWQYWDGASWTAAGASDYNLATEVDATIADFNAANEQIVFRAFLESDGTQQVQLDTVNIEFIESGSPWSFGTWDVGGGENAPVGTHQTTGGNPDGYNDVTISAANSDEVGGYWEQSFENYGTNPTPVTLDFDYSVIDFNGTPDVAEIRVYLDTASGVPTNQIASIGFSAEGGWTAAPQYNLAATITTPDTLYLKLAIWVETGVGGGSGPFTVGFDNAIVGLGNGAHPLSGTLTSSAFDMGDASPLNVGEWDAIIPTVNEGVQIEVSAAPDSGGAPGVWTSWYTIGTSTGTRIPASFNGNQWVRYRATLTGDGTDTPVLQEVRVNYK